MSAATPCNSLKRCLKTIYILFMTFRNLSIWIFYVQSNVLFLVIILNKKISSKCKLQFLADNLRKFFVLNGLCLIWPILDPKNRLLLTLIINKWLWLTVFKINSFLVHTSHKNSKLITLFCLPVICITKGDK